MNRRDLGRLLAASALLPALGPLHAADYPAKPVRIVVPYGPGGASDNFARAIGESLAKDFKQSFVVENKPGAGGIIAANAVMAAPADGHTIYYVTESMYVLTQLTAQHMGRPVAVDMRKEFVPVSTIAEIPIVLSIRSDIPASNLQEFLAYARKQSGALNYASDGPGSSTHLGGEMLKMAGKFDAVHVPYKGTGDQMTGIMGGQIHYVFSAVSAAMNYARNGKMKVIAVAGPRRVAQLPEVATFTEQGLPSVSLNSFHGFAVRAGTNPEIVNLLSQHIQKAAGAPALVQRFTATGLVPSASSPAQFASTVDASFRKWADVLSASKVRLD